MKRGGEVINSLDGGGFTEKVASADTVQPGASNVTRNNDTVFIRPEGLGIEVGGFI